jgi:hypothetical protein
MHSIRHFVQNDKRGVSSLRHSLVAGEDEGGGLNDLNFSNELNRAEGVAYCLRSGGLVSITVARE